MIFHAGTATLIFEASAICPIADFVYISCLQPSDLRFQFNTLFLLYCDCLSRLAQGLAPTLVSPYLPFPPDPSSPGMRLLRRPIAFSLLLLQLTPSLLAFPSEGHVADLAEGKPGRDTLTSNPPLPTTPPSAAGKKDAPVDGKDGRPHQGPFIETEAERDRKKALESDTGGHSTGKKAGGASLSKEGWDTDKSKDLPESTPKELPEDMKDMPKSNDGVMDDRNRLGPKEGTRGTEGGISEKSKGKLSTDDDAEKTAEGPKEVPPLPHSEQEKIKGDTGKSAKPGGAGKAGKISKDEETKSTTSDDSKDKPDSKVEDVNLGGISVRRPEMLYVYY